MTNGQVGLVLRHLRRLVGRQAESEFPDRELVERFVSRRDEGAFLALVERHGPMVLGVCRGVLRHRQDAEDAFQATFLVLARKAGSIRQPEAVGSWLYGVAHHVALTARTTARRVPAARAEAMPADDPLLDLT